MAVYNRVLPMGEILYGGRMIPIVGVGHRMEIIDAMDMDDIVRVLGEDCCWYQVPRMDLYLYKDDPKKNENINKNNI